MWESILSVGTRPSPGCDAICLIYSFCLAEAGQSLRARVFPRVRNAVALSTEIYCSPGDKEPFVSYEQSHCPLFAPLHPPRTFHSSLRSVSTTQKVDSQSPGAPRLALRDVFANCRGTRIWLKGKGEERPSTTTPPPDPELCAPMLHPLVPQSPLRCRDMRGVTAFIHLPQLGVLRAPCAGAD